MKRFLCTLIQFGTEISAETGEKVKELVFNLVVSELMQAKILGKGSVSTLGTGRCISLWLSSLTLHFIMSEATLCMAPS